MCRGGEIFVLDMGKSIRIADLARDVIRLSGYEPATEIGIVFTGIRPGEKLYEEIMSLEEGTEATRHERILAAKLSAKKGKPIRQALQDLRSAMGDPESCLAELRVLISNYWSGDYQLYKVHDRLIKIKAKESECVR